MPIAYPEWTEYRRKRGLDPLGMQNSSVGIYQSLLPGISNVTLRVRYYGFYAWLSSWYAKRRGDTNPETWRRFVRRAEALYALVAQKRGGETGVAGSNWAHAKLRAFPDGRIAFSEDAEPGSPTHYLKQAWGAYGAAYASQLFEIGVFSEAEAHEIPVPSQQLGEPLANCFESVLGSIANSYLEVIDRGSVTHSELDAFGPMTPSAIVSNSEERLLYHRMLFAELGLNRTQDVDRRRTLLLVLTVARQLSHIPDADEVRWTLYSGRLPDGGYLSVPNADLELQRQRWWVYQANDLAHICLEALLKHTLDTLEADPGGVPLSRLMTVVIDGLMAEPNSPPSSWGALLDQTTLAENAASLDVPNAERALSRSLMNATRFQGHCGSDGAWLAIRLLAVLHRRFRSMEPSVNQELLRFDQNAFRSLLTEMRFLESHLQDNLVDTIIRIVEERVIRRHLWVALRKLRYQGDYTFLIETDDGHIRLRAKDGPVFTNPRLNSAIAFLRDIHLLGKAGLTELGQQLVEAT